MTTENLALLKAIGAKMEFLSQRQRVISQNISNADTPGYLPQDVKEADFSRTLGTILSEKSMKTLHLETTDTMHIPPKGDVPNPGQGKQKTVYEVAPVGNAVVMEEQLMNSNKALADYTLMTTLYQKNIGMLKTALGRGG